MSNSNTDTAKKKVAKKDPPELTDEVATKSGAVNSAAAATSADSQLAQTDSTGSNKSKSGGKGLSIFAILLSLVALGGSGFTWYQNQVQRVQSDSSLAVGVSEIGGQVSRLGDSISLLKKQQDDVISEAELASRLLAADVKVDKRLREIIDDQTDLQSAIQKVRSDVQSGVTDFVLDEVSQLLKLANNSALFAGDKKSAINALNLADIHLKELAEPRFSTIRKTINDEIAALQAVELPDIEKLSTQISSIAAQVSDMPLANEPEIAETIVLTSQDDNDTPITWRTELRKIWHDMINAVSIQRVDQPPKPLLAPDQRYFLEQNLLLKLNQAEVALLQKQAGVYGQSLAAAEQWLGEYFDTKNAQVKSALTQLAVLKTQKIAVQLPAITSSYDALQSVKGGQ